MSITGNDVKAAIAGNDTYAFELKVAALFKKHGGNFRHGWYYVDPIEEKSRQFDLRADMFNNRGTRCLRFAVECKNLATGHPLVVSGTTRTYEEAFHHFILSGPHRGGFAAGANTRGIYSQYSFVGKNLIRLNPKGNGLEVKRDEETDIYKRWSQALASAVEMCVSAINLGSEQVMEIEPAVVPAVVVPDGTLWEMAYNEDGTLDGEPKETDATTVFVNHKVELVARNFWMRLSHVNFWTVSGLDRFLAGLHGSPANWDQWFPSRDYPYTPPVPNSIL